MTRNKNATVKALGSKCSACGMVFNDDNSYLADVHHHVPNDKPSRVHFPSSEMSRIKTAGVFVEFLKGKVLLCAMCHRRHHHGEDVGYTVLMPKVVEALGRKFFELPPVWEGRKE